MAHQAVPPTASTPLEVTAAELLKSFIVSDLSALAPSKCSTECHVNGVVDNIKLDDVVSHEMVEVVALAMANIIFVDPGHHRQPPWPPPQICTIRLSCWGISTRIRTGEPQYEYNGLKHPWPPLCDNSSLHELQEIVGQAASFDSQRYSSNGLRVTISAAPESRMLQLHVNILTPLGFLIPKDERKANMKWCCNDLLWRVTNPFGSEYQVTSIPTQMIVRRSELSLFLCSSAPSFLITNYSNGGTVTTYLNLDADCTSLLCMTTHRTFHDTTLMLCRYLLIPLACLRILVSSTIGLQSWFGLVLDSALKHSSFLQLTKEWLTSQWDPGQPEVVGEYSVVAVFNYISSGNAEVEGTIELVGISAHGQFLRKEELEESENCARYDLTNEGKEFLIAWSICCCITTVLQSSNGSSERVCYHQLPMGTEVLDMQLLCGFDITYFSMHNTIVSECVCTEVQQLNLYQCLRNQAVTTHPMANPMELFAGDIASKRCSGTEFQFITNRRPNYQHCSSLRFPSGQDNCFLWISEHITRFPLKLILSVMATCHGEMVSDPNVKFGLFIYLKQFLGWRLFELEPWKPSKQNPSSPHFNTVPACKCSTDQGGKNVMARPTFYLYCDGQDYYRDAFSNQVHVGHDYYIAFVNKISVRYNYYLDQVYYFDKVRGILVFYHDDPDKIKRVRASWDPGKSALRYPRKTSAWGQAEFQEGRNVMTLTCVSQVGPWSRVIDDGLGQYDPPGASATTCTHREPMSRPSSWITNRTANLSSSPVFLFSPTSGSLPL